VEDGGAPRIDAAISAALVVGAAALTLGDRVTAISFAADVRGLAVARGGRGTLRALGSALALALVQWLDKVLESPPVDYDDQEEPLSNRSLSKVGERLRRARALYPAQVFLEKNQKPASHYFKNNFYFTIETEEPELPEAIEFLGAERFLFATDYPHDDPGGRMKFQDVELLRENPKMSETDKEEIRWKNADRLFHSAR
jgi:hypothetical protein